MNRFGNICYIFLCLMLIACNGRDDADIFFPDESMTVSSNLTNQDVTAFAEDLQGYMWIGTSRGLNRFNGHNYHQYLFNPDDSTSLPSNKINCLFTDSENNLWIGTVAGVCRYNKSDDFTRISSPSRFNNVHQIWENSQGRIFINMIGELCEYVPESNSLKVIIESFNPGAAYLNYCFYTSEDKVYSVTDHNIRVFNGRTLELIKQIQIDMCPHYAFLDDNGKIWMSSGERLQSFDTRQDKLVEIPNSVSKETNGCIVNSISHIGNQLYFATDKKFFIYDLSKNICLTTSNKSFPYNLKNEKINRTYADKSGNVWFGIQNHGFTVKNDTPRRFNSRPNLISSLQGRNITSLYVDNDDKIWISDATGKIFSYDILNDSLSEIRLKGDFGSHVPTLLPNIVFHDSRNRLWIINNEQLIEVPNTKSSGAPLSIIKHDEIAERVTNGTESADGTVWVCTTSNKVYGLASQEVKFTAYSLISKGTPVVYSIKSSNSGDLALGAALRNPFIANPRTGETKEIMIWKEWSHTNLTHDFLFLDDDNLMIATYGSGVFKYNIKTDSVIPISGLSCREICSMVMDNKGCIWISTLDGICKYSPDLNTSVSYYASDGIGGNQFNTNAVGKLSTGELVFGGTHGVTVFNPETRISRRSVSLNFEDLRIHNKLVKPGINSPITSKLSYSPTIKLHHDENNFVISFSAFDYCEDEQIRYFYKLEGYNKEWVDLQNNHEAYFANIPPGKYVLKVKITNNDQSIEEIENTININVAPSIWDSWWMRLLYIIVGCGIISLFVSARYRILKEKKLALIKDEETRREQHLNRVNMSFFANISHEFRTPLTMIYAPLKQLRSNDSISDNDKKLLSTIQWSVNRMLRLVNQLMDFNKLENDALPLKVKKCDVIKLLKETIGVHQIGINDKNIRLKQYYFEDSFVTYIDPDKFDKVITNLMSNALKYTPKDGEITSTFDVESEYIIITISDNGISIPEDKLDRIFERHYQVENHKNYGTGIGLYFAKRLMELHHGVIYAENIPSGGVKFTVKFPLKDIYSQSEHVVDSDSESVQFRLYPLENQNIDNIEVMTDGLKEHKIMVIDDDAAIVNYLKLLLSPYYEVLTSYDAESAFDTIKNECPDIVLSDVAMPRKNGYELCQDIKSDFSTSHIPVVLVTAKTSTEEQIAGLDTGADAYVSKPFDPDYLLAMIRMQLRNRERLKNVLSSVTTTDAMYEVASEEPITELSEQDKIFMDNLYALLEKELSNDDLNINTITEKLFISRSKLYYKIKALTGERPNIFFKKYKINRAAELLKTGRYNISEVSDMTGFSTISVFARNFKNQFGMTPSEYLKQRSSQHNKTDD